jgi:hypothetical protein
MDARPGDERSQPCNRNRCARPGLGRKPDVHPDPPFPGGRSVSQPGGATECDRRLTGHVSRGRMGPRIADGLPDRPDGRGALRGGPVWTGHIWWGDGEHLHAWQAEGVRGARRDDPRACGEERGCPVDRWPRLHGRPSWSARTNSGPNRERRSWSTWTNMGPERDRPTWSTWTNSGSGARSSGWSARTNSPEPCQDPCPATWAGLVTPRVTGLLAGEGVSSAWKEAVRPRHPWVEFGGRMAPWKAFLESGWRGRSDWDFR